MSEPPDESAPAGVTRQDVFAVLGALGAIITLTAAVMYYFGWRRSDAQAREMGVDVSLFGFSSQDYVLRSIGSLFIPLLVIAGIGLAWVWGHRRLKRFLESDRLEDGTTRARLTSVVRITFVASVGIAAACVLFSVLAGERWAPWPVRPTARFVAPREWVVPLVLVAATLTAAYARWVAGQLTRRRRAHAGPLWLSILPFALVASTLILGCFWILEEYAAYRGRDNASDLAASVDQLPRAAVTSADPLSIRAPGVSEQLVDPAAGPPRYRTTGLRLLSRSGGKVILLHDGWTPSAGTVIVIADVDDLIWEFSR